MARYFAPGRRTRLLACSTAPEMGRPRASVSRPSANRVAPYGTTAARRGLSRFERSQALSLTNRLAARPFAREPLSGVTFTGSERVSFPAASVTDAWTACRPLASCAVFKERVASPLSGQGVVTVYG